MAIPMKSTDQLVINLDAADDRMEVHVKWAFSRCPKRGPTRKDT